tara:strand:- start:1204 stop:1980 length:777 start_codon:yes stop_codon:yes gene_type:complete
MICEGLPRLVPFRVTLQGSEDSTQAIEPKITIDTDLENLTILPKDLATRDYLMAVCSLIIDDGSTPKKLSMQGWYDLGSFDMDLLSISFDWTDQIIDIWCETYISVDTLQMSEDYSISIPDEYLDMIGKTEKTYIIQSGEINYDIVVDERFVQQDVTEETSNVFPEDLELPEEEQEREDMTQEERDIEDQKEEQERERQAEEEKARYYRELDAKEAQEAKEEQERQAQLDSEKQEAPTSDIPQPDLLPDLGSLFNYGK